MVGFLDNIELLFKVLGDATEINKLACLFGDAAFAGIFSCLDTSTGIP